MGGDDGGAYGCAIGGGLSDVSRLQKPEFSSIRAQKRLRDGSGTARDTAE